MSDLCKRKQNIISWGMPILIIIILVSVLVVELSIDKSDSKINTQIKTKINKESEVIEVTDHIRNCIMRYTIEEIYVGSESFLLCINKYMDEYKIIIK